jgi:diguanylate cyclase (GGDEF)-like protein
MQARPSARRVLIIDDDPIAVAPLKRELDGDYEVCLAGNGAEGVAVALQAASPDLIVLDVLMPDIDGFEVLRRLKAERKTRDIPVIFLSSTSEEEQGVRSLAQGAVDFIKKPYCPPLAKARLAAQLELTAKRRLLDQISGIDPVTAVPNRSAFEQRLATEWKRALRNQRPVSLVLAEVQLASRAADGPNLSLEEEEKRLQHLAAIIEGSLYRPADLLARLGDDRFAVLLPDTDERGARLVANQVLHAVEKLSGGVFEGMQVYMGAATAIPRRESAPSQLREAARTALEDARHDGKPFAEVM